MAHDTRVRLGRAQLGTRKRSLSVYRVTQAELEHLRVLNANERLLDDRPRTRADCLAGGCNAERPCPWVGCRHHLAVDVSRYGSLCLNFPDTELDAMRETCSLDVAATAVEGLELEQVGRLMNLTRERVRQVESVALRSVPRATRRALRELRP